MFAPSSIAPPGASGGSNVAPLPRAHALGYSLTPFELKSESPAFIGVWPLGEPESAVKDRRYRCFLPSRSATSLPLGLRIHFDQRQVLRNEVFLRDALNVRRRDPHETVEFGVEQVRVLQNHRRVAQLLASALIALPAEDEIAQHLVLCFVELLGRYRLGLQPVKLRLDLGFALGGPVSVIHDREHEEEIGLLGEVPRALRLYGDLLLVDQPPVDARTLTLGEDFGRQAQRISVRQAVGRHVVSLDERRQRDRLRQLHDAFRGLRRLDRNLAAGAVERYRAALERSEIVLDE